MLRHVEKVSGNVAATCRYYGISRQCYYGWLRRYEADGFDGLKDRSQRPHHSPRATGVVALVGDYGDLVHKPQPARVHRTDEDEAAEPLSRRSSILARQRSLQPTHR